MRLLRFVMAILRRIRASALATAFLVSVGLKKDLAFLLTWLATPFCKGDSVLLFGEPLITLKYIRGAIGLLGVDAKTFVKHVYPAFRPADFDIVSTSEFRFAIELAKARYIVVFYDSLEQFLGPLGRRTFTLYKTLSGKKLIAMPYGGDAFLYSLVPDQVLRHGLLVSYPSDVDHEDVVRNRIRTVNRAADLVIGCLGHTANLPRWDMLPVHYYPVDTSHIRSIDVQKRPGFTVVHTPNHRSVKGTELLIRAVQELREEGFEVELRLLEGVPNAEVLRELKQCHVLAEQLLGGGYALSAMEGMAAGLAVIAHFRVEVTEIFNLFSYMGDCPIVSVERTVDSIKTAIRHCKKNLPELSARSLAYVERYHSYRSAAVVWREILRSVDAGERPIRYFEPKVGRFYEDLKKAPPL